MISNKNSGHTVKYGPKNKEQGLLSVCPVAGYIALLVKFSRNKNPGNLPFTSYPYLQ